MVTIEQLNNEIKNIGVYKSFGIQIFPHMLLRCLLICDPT